MSQAPPHPLRPAPSALPPQDDQLPADETCQWAVDLVRIFDRHPALGAVGLRGCQFDEKDRGRGPGDEQFMFEDPELKLNFQVPACGGAPTGLMRGAGLPPAWLDCVSVAAGSAGLGGRKEEAAARSWTDSQCLCSDTRCPPGACSLCCAATLRPTPPAAPRTWTLAASTRCLGTAASAPSSRTGRCPCASGRRGGRCGRRACCCACCAGLPTLGSLVHGAGRWCWPRKF